MHSQYKWREVRPGKRGGKGKKVIYHLLIVSFVDGVMRTTWTTMWIEYMVRDNTFRVNHNLPKKSPGSVTRYEYVQHGIASLDDAKQFAEAHLNLLGEGI